VISPTQTSLLNNTQHSQETDIHALGGIRTRNPRKRAVADSLLRSRGHRDRPFTKLICQFCVVLINIKMGYIESSLNYHGLRRVASVGFKQLSLGFVITVLPDACVRMSGCEKQQAENFKVNPLSFN